VKDSNDMAPIRLRLSFSSSELMACRHGCDTGGFVIGYFGSPFTIFSARCEWLFASNGRYSESISVRFNGMRKGLQGWNRDSNLIVDALIESNSQ
jgi:hypothetical protein